MCPLLGERSVQLAEARFEITGTGGSSFGKHLVPNSCQYGSAHGITRHMQNSLQCGIRNSGHQHVPHRTGPSQKQNDTDGRTSRCGEAVESAEKLVVIRTVLPERSQFP